MKKSKKYIGVAGIVISTLSLQGCLIAAIGGGWGAMKYGDAKKAEAETKCKKSYPDYFMSMEKVNHERQKMHLKPEVIMSMSEYCHIEEDKDKKTDK